ncbi:unnamed protein product [Penicillium glandicola]
MGPEWGNRPDWRPPPSKNRVPYLTEYREFEPWALQEKRRKAENLPEYEAAAQEWADQGWVFPGLLDSNPIDCESQNGWDDPWDATEDDWAPSPNDAPWYEPNGEWGPIPLDKPRDEPEGDWGPIPLDEPRDQSDDNWGSSPNDDSWDEPEDG